MANTFTLIEAQTLTGSLALVTLGNGGTIPQTYTDLKVVVSWRASTLDDIYAKFNTLTTNQSGRYISGAGSGTPASGTGTYYGISQVTTGNVFSSFEMYIPNYTSSNYKSFSVENVAENNATLGYSQSSAGLWSASAAITSLSFYCGTATIEQYSTFYLYGIKNS